MKQAINIIKPKKNPVAKMAGKYKNIKPKKKVDLEKIRDEIDYSNL